MKRRGGLLTGIILAVSSTIFFLFIGFPLFNPGQGDQTGPPLGMSDQSPQTMSAVSNEIDSCVSNPSSDCDQVMLQVSRFCQQDQSQARDYPFCSDSRIQMYLQQRSLDQIHVNGAHG